MAVKTLEQMIAELFGEEEETLPPFKPTPMPGPQEPSTYLDWDAAQPQGTPPQGQGKVGLLLQLLPMLLAPAVGGAVAGGRGALAATAGLGGGMAQNQRYQELMAQRQKESEQAQKIKFSEIMERRREADNRTRALKELKEMDIAAEVRQQEQATKLSQGKTIMDILVKLREQERESQPTHYVTTKGTIPIADYQANPQKHTLVYESPFPYKDALKLLQQSGKEDPLGAQQWKQWLIGFAAERGLLPEQLNAKQYKEAVEQYKELGTATGVVVPVVETGPDGQPRIIYRKRSDAIGKEAPRPVYNVAGVPSLGGVSGAGTFPPPPPSESAQASISSYSTALDLLKDIEPMMKKQPTLGPVAGRIKLAEIERLGGLGATTDEIRLATKLKQLFVTQAFGEGGKQLTPTEKIEFQAMAPKLDDTIASAWTKTQEAFNWLQTKLRNRYMAMPKRQRMQLPEVGRRLGISEGDTQEESQVDPLGIRK